MKQVGAFDEDSTINKFVLSVIRYLAHAHVNAKKSVAAKSSPKDAGKITIL